MAASHLFPPRLFLPEEAISAVTVDRVRVRLEADDSYGKHAQHAPDELRVELVARRFAVGETQVRHYLAYCRGSLRRLLQKGMREYTAREEDVDPELQAILKG
jgi:hypothetical protein